MSRPCSSRPSHAIVFGDALEPDADIVKAAKDPRSYRLLEQLNTDPGVHYLARVRDRTIG